jgi:hypothetical protein
MRKLWWTGHNSIAPLKAIILKDWGSIPAAYVSLNRKSFRARMYAMLAADSGHIE